MQCGRGRTPAAAMPVRVPAMVRRCRRSGSGKWCPATMHVAQSTRGATGPLSPSPQRVRMAAGQPRPHTSQRSYANLHRRGRSLVHGLVYASELLLVGARPYVTVTANLVPSARMVPQERALAATGAASRTAAPHVTRNPMRGHFRTARILVAVPVDCKVLRRSPRLLWSSLRLRRAFLRRRSGGRIGPPSLSVFGRRHQVSRPAKSTDLERAVRDFPTICDRRLGSST